MNQAGLEDALREESAPAAGMEEGDEVTSAPVTKSPVTALDAAGMEELEFLPFNSVDIAFKRPLTAAGRRADFRNRFVRDGRNGVHLIKNSQLFQIQTRVDPGWWPIKNDPVREFIASRVARAVGGNVADVVIPEAGQRVILAKHLGSAVKPDEVYLVKHTVSYQLSDNEVKQEDPKKAFTRNLVASLLIRKADFVSGNEWFIGDSDEVTMMFDNDQAFNSHHASIHAFADNFILNYFPDARKMRRFEITNFNELVEKLDVEELSAAVSEVESFSFDGLHSEVSSHLSDRYGTAMDHVVDPIFNYLEERQRQFRQDVRTFFSIIRERDSSRAPAVIPIESILEALTDGSEVEPTEQEPQNYDDVVNQATGSIEERSLFDDESGQARTEFLLVPDEGVLVPADHLALRTGFKVITHSSTGDWYIAIRTFQGETVPRFVVMRSPSVPTAIVTSPASLSADSWEIHGVRLDVSPEQSVVIRPAGSSRVMIERLPGELELAMDDQAILGEMIERQFVRARERGDGNISDLLALDGYQPQVLYEWEGVQLIRSVVTDGQAYISLRISQDRLSQQALNSIVGQIEPLALTRLLPIKLADGFSVARLEFIILSDDSLLVSSSQVPEERLRSLRRLMLRLAAHLSTWPGGPTYNELSQRDSAELVRLVTESQGDLGESYRTRHHASIALIYKGDFESVQFSLNRFGRSSDPTGFIEPTPSMRRDIMAHIYWRHHLRNLDLQFNDEERIVVRDAMGRALTEEGWEQRIVYERLAALQALGRVTPESDEEEILKSIAIVNQVQKLDQDPEIQELAGKLTAMFNLQLARESSQPIQLQIGPRENLQGDTGDVNGQNGNDQTGLEEVRFFDGYVDGGGQVAPDSVIQAGLVQPGQRRAVVPAAVGRNFNRVFHHPTLQPHFAGLEAVSLPADPAQARSFMTEQGITDAELILLPASVEAGLEQQWRPEVNVSPIVVVSAQDLDLADEQIFRAWVMVAQNLEGGIYRAGLEGITRARLDDGAEYLSLQF